MSKKLESLDQYAGENPVIAEKKERPVSLFARNAKNLKRLRKSKGYTLYELASLTALSPSYLSRLESSDRRLNVEVMTKIALALGCHEGEFFSDDHSKIVEVHNGFQKNLPIYRMTARGVNVLNSEHNMIDFSEVMEYSFRTRNLASSDNGFAIYAQNDDYAPLCSTGDLVYFDELPCVVGDNAMIVDNDSCVYIGKVAEIVSIDDKLDSNSNYGLSDNDNDDASKENIVLKPISGSSLEFAKDEISMYKMVSIDFK